MSTLSPFRAILSRLSPPGPGGKLSILIFHRILEQPDPLLPDEPDARRFDHILSWLKTWFNVLPLDNAISALKAGTLPARAASITFDDGYADNCTNALPILLKHDMSATFFIATGFLNGGRMWNDTIIEAIRGTRETTVDLDRLGLGKIPADSAEAKRQAINQLLPVLKHREPSERLETVQEIVECCGAALRDDLMLTTPQLKKLHSAGMVIGAHTVNHPILQVVDEATARREMDDSRTQLQNWLGDEVRLFAYPNGKFGRDYGESHARLAEELGFDAALSTDAGASRHGSNVYHLRRFTPWDKTGWRFGLRMAQNLYRASGSL